MLIFKTKLTPHKTLDCVYSDNQPRDLIAWRLVSRSVRQSVSRFADCCLRICVFLISLAAAAITTAITKNFERVAPGERRKAVKIFEISSVERRQQPRSRLTAPRGVLRPQVDGHVIAPGALGVASK